METITATVTRDTPFVPEDDTFHRLSDDPFETETNWWSFSIPGRKIGCWLHAAVHPNRNSVTWRVFVWDDRSANPESLAYYKKVADAPMPAGADLRDITFPEGGYSLKMLKPLMGYQLSYRDAARDFALDIEFHGVHAPRRFTPGEAPALFNPHLDQLCQVTGEMVLNGERLVVDGLGIRDRTWGPRGGRHSASQKAKYVRNETHVLHPGGPRWREIERERGRGRIQYIFGHADAGHGFLGFVRPQDGDAEGWSPMNVGWLLRDGVFGHIDKTKSKMRNYRDPLTGCSRHMQVVVVDEQGRTLEAEGFALSHIHEESYGIQSLFRWEFDGKVGWGEDQDGWRADHLSRMVDAMRRVR